MTSRRGKILTCLLACWLLSGSWAAAQRVLVDHEYEHKAAYLYHFARLTTWPDLAPGAPLKVVIVGDATRFGNQLRRLEKQTEQANHPVQVTVVKAVTAEQLLPPCQMVFLSGRAGAEVKPARDHLAETLKQTAGKPILVVSENRAFAREGAAVNFYVEQNRLYLLINTTAAQQAGITIPPAITKLSSVASKSQAELNR